MVAESMRRQSIWGCFGQNVCSEKNRNHLLLVFEWCKTSEAAGGMSNWTPCKVHWDRIDEERIRDL